MLARTRLGAHRGIHQVARKGRNKCCRTKDLVKRHVRWLAPAETVAGEFARHSAFRMNRQNCVRAAIPNMRSVNAARQTLLRENSQLGNREIPPFPSPPSPRPRRRAPRNVRINCGNYTGSFRIKRRAGGAWRRGIR